MTGTAYQRITDALRRNGSKVTERAGGRAQAQCPAHEDRAPSLSVTGIDGMVLLHCHAGCSIDQVLDALAVKAADLYDESRGATYRYDGGRTVHRTPDKRFRQTGTDNPPELYRLAKVRRAVADARPVLVVEGEKDVHAAEAIGLTATCAPMGAGKWSKVDASPLFGGQIFVVADQDEPGRAHAADVLASLQGHANARAFAPAVGKDLSDHIAAGHSISDLRPIHLAPVFPVSTPYVRNEKHAKFVFYDVAAMLKGGLPDPPAPTVLRRRDGNCLFYAGQVNSIFGDPESGKTWLALCAVAETLLRGGRAVIIDMDHGGPQAAVSRLLDLGVPESVLADPDRFRYVEPEDREHLKAVVAACEGWCPRVAVVDSVGELLPLLGLNSNNPDDFTTANARVLKPLATVGAAVLAIDHMAKNVDSRNAGPTGTTAKRRAMGGVSIRVTVKEPFTPGRGGSAYLTVNKDRHGGLRRHCKADGREPSAGLFVLDSSSDETTWQVTVPQDGETAAAAGVRPDDIALVAALDPPYTSVRDAQKRTGISTQRAGAAIAALRFRNVSETSEDVSRFPHTGSETGNTDPEPADTLDFNGSTS